MQQFNTDVAACLAGAAAASGNRWGRKLSQGGGGFNGGRGFEGDHGDRGFEGDRGDRGFGGDRGDRGFENRGFENRGFEGDRGRGFEGGHGWGRRLKSHERTWFCRDGILVGEPPTEREPHLSALPMWWPGNECLIVIVLPICSQTRNKLIWCMLQCNIKGLRTMLKIY